jgi:predicted nucleotidyltransferase
MSEKNAKNSGIIRDIRKFKESIRKKFGVEKVIVFGSAARGDMDENSDIDIILVSRKFSRVSFFKRHLGIREMWTLDYPVDMLCYSPEEFQKERKKVSIVSEALREGIEI